MSNIYSYFLGIATRFRLKKGNTVLEAKINALKFLTLIFSVAMFSVIVPAFLKGNYILAAVDSALLLFLAITLFLLNTKKNYGVISHSYSFLVIVFTIYIIFSGEMKVAALLWIPIFPLVFFFLLGKRMGLIFGFFDALVLFVIATLRYFEVIKIHYDFASLRLLFFVYLIALAFAYLYESINEYVLSIESELLSKNEDVRKAQGIQRNLNAVSLPAFPNYDMQALYMPSEKLGGDYFDVIRFDEKILIILGDCTGHGIEASMDAIILKSITDRYIPFFKNPASTGKFLEFINRDICKYTHDGRFPTMFAALLDTKKNTFFYSNAGAPLPFLIQNGRVETLEQAKGFLLGFDRYTQYETKSIILTEGAKICFHSDAILEMVDKEGEYVPVDKVKGLMGGLSNSKKCDINMFVDKLKEMNIKVPLADDLTLLLLSFSIPYQDKGMIVNKEGITHQKSLARENLIKFHYSSFEIGSIITALEEAMLNALEHGNRFSTEKKVVVETIITPEKATFIVSDEGEGFNPDTAPDPLDETRREDFLNKTKVHESHDFLRGRGIWLMHEFMDSIKYNDQGTSVRLEKYRHIGETVFRFA